MSTQNILFLSTHYIKTDLSFCNQTIKLRKLKH